MSRLAGAVAGAAAVALAGGAAVLRLRRRWLQVTVDGPSMLPTFAPGDRTLARRGPATVRAGDVVVVRRPVADRWLVPGTSRPAPAAGPLMIKRVAAGPGQPVPAVVTRGWGAPGGSTVPDGMYVLLGDNLDDSLDSRILGCCPAASIVGVISGVGGLSRAPAPAAARSSASGRPAPAPATRPRAAR